MRRRHLAQRRKTVGLNQVALARRVGVDRSTVVRWERGQSVPLPWCRPRLAHALGISREALDAMLEPTEPVTELANIEVTLSRDAAGAVRVELVDPRCGLRLVSLDPREAASLAGLLVSHSARAGWQAGNEPGG